MALGFRLNSLIPAGRAGFFAIARNTLLATCLTGVAGVAPLVLAQNNDNVSTASATDTGVAPAMLIESMSLALRTLNYEGVFVHAQGTNLTSMHILHATNERGEIERLTSLDGEARQVIRNNSLVTCIWPGSQSVIISKSKPRDLLPRVDAGLASSGRYQFSLGAADRVAGRDAYVVNVIPRDEFRYGYRFWIDADNYMLLRSMLLDGPDTPVEQVIFTRIDFSDTIDTARFEIIGVEDRSDVVSWLEPKKTAASAVIKNQRTEQANRISFSTLPDGYRKVSETYSSMPIKTGPVSHAMLTDGMASVSVYVEYVTGVEQDGATLGLSRMGAMNAFGVSTESALITVVGEVPEATVRAIAVAVILNE